jgi:hypothetical protein
MNERSHHPHSASQAWRQENCPGSFVLSKGLVKKVSEYAKEGTEKHEIMALLTRELFNLWRKNRDQEDPPEHADELISSCVTFLWSLFRIYEPVDIKIERSVELGRYTGGWCDLTLLCPHPSTSTGLIISVDWKFGYQPMVTDEVWTAASRYTACLMDEYKTDEAQFHFFNPRIGEHKKATFTRSKHLDGIQKKIRATYENCRKPEPWKRLRPGPWCKFCPAIGVCNAAMVSSQELIDAPKSIPQHDRLEALAERVPVVEGLIKSFKEEMREFLAGGGESEYYELRQVNGARSVKHVGNFLYRCREFVDATDFYDDLKLPLTAAEKRVVEAIVQKAKDDNGKLTKKQAKEVFKELTGDSVRPGAPVTKMVRK